MVDAITGQMIPDDMEVKELEDIAAREVLRTRRLSVTPGDL